jgi:transposase
LLAEFGVILPVGREKMMAQLPQALARLEDTLPAMVLETLREQRARLERLSEDIEGIERKLWAWRKEDEAVKRLMQIPGVGLLTATAAVATIGDAKVFSSGRECAAFLGLVPRQSGTGGKVRLSGITKRGDVYLRKLLVHGARAVLQHAKQLDPWLEGLLARQRRKPRIRRRAFALAPLQRTVRAFRRSYANPCARSVGAAEAANSALGIRAVATSAHRSRLPALLRKPLRTLSRSGGSREFGAGHSRWRRFSPPFAPSGAPTQALAHAQ